MVTKSLLPGVAAAILAVAPQVARANVLYFADPVNFDQQETDTLFVYGASGTTGTVSAPNGFSSGFTVGSNNVTSIVVPSSYDLTSSGTVTNNGFTVATTSASANVGASILSREPFTTDTSYLFDSTSLGTSYYAVGATNSVNFPSQVSIVGTQANTIVTVTPSTTLASGQAAGVPFNVTIGAGQAVLFADSGTGSDITGTKITSTAPIAVFGGNQCADVPAGSTACDHTLTALPSTNNYTSHAVVPTTVGTEGAGTSNLLRVLAATDGTVVTYNGAVVATLNAGQYADIRTGAGGELSSNNPVLLNEYLTGQSEHSGTPGDPAQSYIPGVNQWLSTTLWDTIAR